MGAGKRTLSSWGIVEVVLLESCQRVVERKGLHWHYLLKNRKGQFGVKSALKGKIIRRVLHEKS